MCCVGWLVGVGSHENCARVKWSTKNLFDELNVVCIVKFRLCIHIAFVRSESCYVMKLFEFHFLRTNLFESDQFSRKSNKFIFVRQGEIRMADACMVKAMNKGFAVAFYCRY